MKRSLRIATLLVLASGVACSSSTKHLVRGDGDAGADTTLEAGAHAGAGGSPAGRGGAGSSVGGSSSSGGATGGDSATGGGGASKGGAPSKFGQIIVQWDGAKVSGTALFQGGGLAAGGAPALCKTSVVGPCQVQLCSTDASGPSDPQPANAGTINVTGGTEPLTFTPSPMFDSLYDLSSGATATFTAGAPLTAAASGGDVPAFSGKSVLLPSAIVVAATFTTIPVDQDLTLTWTGGSAIGKVVFAISVLGDTQIGSLDCEYEPTAHGGVVPKDALGLLPACATGQGPVCNWTLEPRSTLTFQAGDFSIDFSARATGKKGSFGS